MPLPHALLVGAALLAAAWLSRKLLLARWKRQVRCVFRQRRLRWLRECRAEKDAVLQGVQALSWIIQDAADRMAPGDPVRENLRSAVEAAEVLLTEGHDHDGAANGAGAV